jgi:Flp pilus assembly protein TadB
MTFTRKKVGKNTYQTTNLKTGTTRTTHSIKTGASTTSSQSWNSKGNTRRTETSNVGGRVTRKQTSSSPKKYKSTSSRSRSSGRQTKFDKKVDKWVLIFMIGFFILQWIVNWFSENPIWFGVFVFITTFVVSLYLYIKITEFIARFKE